MNRYMNKLNIGMIMCEKYDELDGKIENIYGIKNNISLDHKNKATFNLICDANFIEFEIPEGTKTLSFRFYIRTLGGEESYIIPFIVSEMRLSDNVKNVLTHEMPMIINIKDFEFPRKGRFAIEVYKYFGEIDTEIENKNIKYYREYDNFVNAINFEVI